MTGPVDVISPEAAKTLDGLFRERVRRSAQVLAYRNFDDEIIVMSNAEKVPPVDMEAAIMQDTLFEQVMVMGEGKPYLTALVVLNREQWTKFASEAGLNVSMESDMTDPKAEKLILERVQKKIQSFPDYAQIYRVEIFAQPWTVENGLLTSTMKLERAKVLGAYQQVVEELYAGH
ncbi:MAG: hypothetical protein ACKVP2_11250 [Burkholderiales bacterium]